MNTIENEKILEKHGFSKTDLGFFKKEVAVDDFIKLRTVIYLNANGLNICDVQMKSGTQTDEEAVYIANGSELNIPANESVETLILLAEHVIEDKLQKMSDNYSEKL